LEEFELANSLFGNNGKPRICIFQKDINLPKNLSKADANSRFDFLDRLKEMEHFPVLFENTDQLVNRLENAIDKLLQNEDFVKQLKTE